MESTQETTINETQEKQIMDILELTKELSDSVAAGVADAILVQHDLSIVPRIINEVRKHPTTDVNTESTESEAA